MALTCVELRAHSAFSFGDGAMTPEALAARAAELGYPAIGLTDCADLGGVPRFVVAAEKRGIRPEPRKVLPWGQRFDPFFPGSCWARSATGKGPAQV